MEILKLKPVCKDYLWGGNRLAKEFNKNTPYEITAESWEISANKNGKSIIKNGEYSRLNLEELFSKENLRKEIFGNKTINLKEFPILIKFIDANKNLSVQVHPDNEYARKYENSLGKTEMWYIMDCNEDSKIVCGVNEDINKEQLEKIVRSGKIKEGLKYINVQKGDSILIKPGTIHAIMEGTLICEIQQNADLTYRVYDWDRVDKNGKSRELHIDKALDVINLNNVPNKVQSEEIENQNLVDCEFFKTDKIQVKDKYCDNSDQDTFITMNVVDGEGKVRSIANNQEFIIRRGDSFLIPANLGEFEIVGNLTLLKSSL